MVYNVNTIIPSKRVNMGEGNMKSRLFENFSLHRHANNTEKGHRFQEVRHSYE